AWNSRHAECAPTSRRHHERGGTPFGVSPPGRTDHEPAGGSGGYHPARTGGSTARAGSSAPLPRGGNRSAHLLGATDFEAGRGVEWRHRQISSAGGNPDGATGAIDVVRPSDARIPTGRARATLLAAPHCHRVTPG